MKNKVGRPKGLNRYGEATKPIRVPISKINDVYSFLDKHSHHNTCPLFSSKVPAGFPSPADDYIEASLNLNEYIIQHPSSTFFVRASAHSMINAGIFSGDLLVVDKSLTPTHGRIIIAAIDGELTVKRLWREANRVQLRPENNQYQPIDITAQQDMVIWGVVTHVIHEAT